MVLFAFLPYKYISLVFQTDMEWKKVQILKIFTSVNVVINYLSYSGNNEVARWRASRLVSNVRLKKR